MIFYFVLQESTQRFALPALGRAAERRPIGKRLKRRKLLENAAESPASGARFVGRFLLCKTRRPKKEITAITPNFYT